MAKRWMSALVVLVVALAIGGCLKPDDVPEQHDDGRTRLTLMLGAGSVPNAKTIFPDKDMEVASYSISGVGPDSETFGPIATSGTSETVYDLVEGEWTINVNGYNLASEQIGVGSDTATIEGGRETTVNIQLSPLSGTGTLAQDIRYLMAEFTGDPVVAGGVYSQAGALVQASTYTITPDTEVGNITASESVNNGYWMLIVTLTDTGLGRVVRGFAEVIRIVTGETTYADIDFSGLGDLIVNIDGDLGDPIELSLSGVPVAPVEQDIANTFSVTATPVGIAPASCLFNWYLNGEAHDSGAGLDSVSINPNALFSNQEYRLDCAVFSLDGRRGGSEWGEFEVIPVP